MKFRMPYVYRAMVKPPRKQNWAVEDFGGYLKVEIPEATDEAAPVAVEWTQPGFGVDAPFPTYLRAHEGRYYAPARNAANEVVTADSISDRDIHVFTHEGPHSEPRAIDRFKAGRINHALSDFRQSMNSTEEAVIEDIRQSLAKLLVVGGVLHEAHPLPLIKATQESFSDYDRIVFSISTHAEPKAHWSVMHFPIQSAEEARDWADAMKAGGGKDIRVVEKLDIRVVRPDLLPMPDHFAMDLRKLIHTHLEMAGKTLYIMPDAYIDAWQDLRGAFAGLEDGCQQDAIDEAMAAWRHLLTEHDRVEEGKAARHGNDYSPERETEHQLFARAAARWENSPIEFDVQLARHPQI
ncbi:hypothetical protein OIU34_17250 [Pararhizobium sp. BT-229]|uniref:hypothetical protein n=1 Tax=Pararhizobium sp. BT-229 TaxID=2986923 RepID=UPI0021F76DF0|nr:hypothetical protein [Pararhizobium sp. BT-229]MCV9963649.1 hypothetical protein [Pararhizobium sp. BT-229]